jgi:hypothetical protein
MSSAAELPSAARLFMAGRVGPGGPVITSTGMKDLRRADVEKDATAGDKGAVSGTIIHQICSKIIGEGPMPAANFLHQIERKHLVENNYNGTRFLNSVDKASVKVAVVDVGSTSRYITAENLLVCPATWTDPGPRDQPGADKVWNYYPRIGNVGSLTTCDLFGFGCIDKFEARIPSHTDCNITVTMKAGMGLDSLTKTYMVKWSERGTSSKPGKAPFYGNPLIHEAINGFPTTANGALTERDLPKACEFALAKNGLHGDPGLPAWLLEFAFDPAVRMNLRDTCVITGDLVEAVTTLLLGEGLLLRQQRSVLDYARQMGELLSQTYKNPPAKVIIEAITKYLDSGKARKIPGGPAGERVEDMLERAMFIPGVLNMNPVAAAAAAAAAAEETIKYKLEQLEKDIADEVNAVGENNAAVIGQFEVLFRPEFVIGTTTKGDVTSKMIRSEFMEACKGSMIRDTASQAQAAAVAAAVTASAVVAEIRATADIDRKNNLLVKAATEMSAFRKRCTTLKFQEILGKSREKVLVGFNGLFKIPNGIIDIPSEILGRKSFLSKCLSSYDRTMFEERGAALATGGGVAASVSSSRKRRNRSISRRRYAKTMQIGGNRATIELIITGMITNGALESSFDTESFSAWAIPYIEHRLIEDGEGEILVAVCLLLPNYMEVTTGGDSLSFEEFDTLYTIADTIIWGTPYGMEWIRAWVDEEGGKVTAAAEASRRDVAEAEAGEAGEAGEAAAAAVAVSGGAMRAANSAFVKGPDTVKIMGADGREMIVTMQTQLGPSFLVNTTFSHLRQIVTTSGAVGIPEDPWAFVDSMGRMYYDDNNFIGINNGEIFTMNVLPPPPSSLPLNSQGMRGGVTHITNDSTSSENESLLHPGEYNRSGQAAKLRMFRTLVEAGSSGIKRGANGTQAGRGPKSTRRENAGVVGGGSSSSSSSSSNPSAMKGVNSRKYRKLRKSRKTRKYRK